MRHRAEWICYCFGALAITGAATLAWWLAVAGPDVVYRIVRFNLSSVEDAHLFPQRPLMPAEEPFRFRTLPGSASEELNANIAGRRIDLGAWLPQSDTTALVVIRDDAIVFEWYADGRAATDASLSFSVAKSILSLLVGCAIADGYLVSVDQPVTDYIPELKAHGFDAVTLDQLLQMTSGIDYAENDWPLGIHPRFYYTQRLEHEILGLRLAKPPGAEFEYKSGDAYLLTLALTRALRGRSITAYTQDRLWTPLGMEFAGAWNVDHDPGGIEKTACCLVVTARDLAKLGRLYVNRGEWQGRQIVPAAWIDRVLQPTSTARRSERYRDLWWRIAPHRDAILATGHLGQFLYVNPGTGTIVVRQGTARGGLSTEQWQALFESVAEDDNVP
jgi:CubicO group peptidase (beta-lactamase class C family)